MPAEGRDAAGAIMRSETTRVGAFATGGRTANSPRKLALCAALVVAGCRSLLIDRTDGEVYRLLEDRQQAALGATSDVHIGEESGSIGATDRMYEFNPRAVDSQVPNEFKQPRVSGTAPGAETEDTQEQAEAGAPAAADVAAVDPVAAMTESIFAPSDLEQVTTFGLHEAVRYAMKHGRNLQSAKEDLYLAALDLTLERHLWTPQFVASVSGNWDYIDPGELPEVEDDAFGAVSDISLSQRLPYGGTVTARVIADLMRDLDQHVTVGESGAAILEAEIPLFRGAGKVAYESRYRAERELIYAARTLERFRREFMVLVAADYFNLQQSKAAIGNTFKAYQSRLADWEKADFFQQVGRSRTIFEAPRAKSSLRQAESQLVSAKERYASALDRFKIVIGMPVGQLLDVMDQESDEAAQAVDVLLPNVSEAVAAETALKYRLDLLNVQDAVDDARRGAVIAQNNILPDLDFTGSVAWDSDPEHLKTSNYNADRSAYHAGLQFRVDDRKTERNAYRASLVLLRRAQRQYEESEDTVRADVQRALRRVAQQENLRRIQALNVEENEFRLQAARAQFDLGKSTNQDVVDAENDLLAARNDLATAVAAYRVAILEFRRDTGTLRLTHDGRLDMRALAIDDGG